MENFNVNDLSTPLNNIEPQLIVDVATNNQIYIGISNNTKNTGNPTWKIKYIWQTGTVWNFGYPNGDQSFAYIWDLRDSYNYS
jgi:hypothetical protein